MLCDSIVLLMKCGAVRHGKGINIMTKQGFKALMRAYRKQLASTLWNQALFAKAHGSNDFARSCLRPRYQPIVSRDVMLYLFSKGGLEAVSHIDNVEIKYN